MEWKAFRELWSCLNRRFASLLALLLTSGARGGEKMRKSWVLSRLSLKIRSRRRLEAASALVDENPKSKHVEKSLMLMQSSDSLQSHSGLQGKISRFFFAPSAVCAKLTTQQNPMRATSQQPLSSEKLWNDCNHPRSEQRGQGEEGMAVMKSLKSS